MRDIEPKEDKSVVDYKPIFLTLGIIDFYAKKYQFKTLVDACRRNTRSCCSDRVGYAGIRCTERRIFQFPARKGQWKPD
jgi:hypothetical protein